MKSMKRIVATDLDGVLATNRHDVRQYRPWKLHQWYGLCTPTDRCNQHYDVILTGRRIHYKKVTERWLEKNGASYDLLIMFPNTYPKNNKTLRQYKATKINELEIGVYYEDDERIFAYLRKNCPDTIVIFVSY